MRHDAGILARPRYPPILEVARVGDRVDPIDGQVPTGRHRRLGQQTEIADLAMDLLLGDQFVLGVHRDLDVVADTDPGRGVHRPRLSGSVKESWSSPLAASASRCSLKPLTPPLDRSDLFPDVLHFAAAGAALVLPVGLVEPVEITRQPLVALGQRLLQLRFGKVPLPAVHCLDPSTVDCHQLAPEQLQFAA